MAAVCKWYTTDLHKQLKGEKKAPQIYSFHNVDFNIVTSLQRHAKNLNTKKGKQASIV